MLRRATGDEKLAESIKEDYTRADITESERAMLDYSVMLTKNALDVTPEILDGLRKHNYDDTAIVQITLIASWFNYINRVADALGIGRENEKQ